MTRSPSGRYRDWSLIIRRARARPRSWVVRLPDEPARLARNVRERNHPALHLPDGRLEARLVNGYLDARGRKRGDVYIRFVPYPTDVVPSTTMNGEPVRTPDNPQEQGGFTSDYEEHDVP